VESEPGRGSTFGLALPIDARLAQRPPSPSQAGEQAPAPPPGSPTAAPRPAASS
jgi:hypothetical protein